VTFEFIVTNSGDDPAQAVRLIATIPEQTTLVEISEGGESVDDQAIWELASLPANTQVTMSFTVVLNAELVPRTHLTTAYQLTSLDPGGQAVTGTEEAIVRVSTLYLAMALGGC